MKLIPSRHERLYDHHANERPWMNVTFDLILLLLPSFDSLFRYRSVLEYRGD